MHAAAAQAIIKADAEGKSLFVLVPQEDRRWEMQRLTEWATGKPVVEELTFDGDDSKSDLDYIQADMTPTPDGERLLIRILALELDDAEYRRHASLILVDLKTYRVVWRRLSDDPLLADSRIGFIDPNTFVSVQGPAPSKRPNAHYREFVADDILGRNPVSLGVHHAGLYSLQDLAPIAPLCSYEVTSAPDIPPGPDEHKEGETDAPLEEDDVMLDTQEPQVVVRPVQQSCDPLMRAVHVTSMELLPGIREVAYHLGRNGWPGCQLDERSALLDLSAYDCRSGQMTQKGVFETVDQEERLSAWAAAPSSLRVPLRRNEPYSASIAKVNGNPALVLLRKGLRVEVYVKPTS